MNNRNKTGPGRDPCETPDEMSTKDDSFHSKAQFVDVDAKMNQNTQIAHS